MIRTKYRLYHSDQEGFKHPRGSKRFVFSPERPFRPLGLVIFGASDALLESVLVGMQEQLAVGPIPAEVLGPHDFTIGQLEMLEKSSRMQNILNSKGVPRIEMMTANIGTYLTVVLDKPVDIVAFWGLEQDVLS